MNAATEAIAIDTLTKNFGAVRALDGLNLRVERGEVHGFLGPNGAGKSTTIRILLGLVRADSGSVRLLGGDPWTDAVALHRHRAPWCCPVSTRISRRRRCASSWAAARIVSLDAARPAARMIAVEGFAIR